jgi:hypothetical protein
VRSLTEQSSGKLTRKDATTATVLKVAPWAAFLAATLPAPTVFVILFLIAQTTETAALYLLLVALSLGLGVAVGLILVLGIWLYRRRWLAALRDRLASDGITASEVVWFRSELTSAERASLSEMQKSNPLLADAYLETLAARLTASRILSRARSEILKVERRLNRARNLGTNTKSLQEDLEADREKLEQLRQRATQHLVEAKTRLQVIEATASRKLNESETNLMMQRLGATQDSLPLVLQMAQMEQQALSEGNDFSHDFPSDLEH